MSDESIIIPDNISETDSDDQPTPPEIAQRAKNRIENVLPTKSKEKYTNTYNKFMQWTITKETKPLSENTILTYLTELSKTHKPSTLWATYSMLKTTLNINNNINITEYGRLIPFLKKQSKGYIPKKSKVLTSEQIQKFLNKADDQKYLFYKVAMIFGICGACRRVELTNITINDIEDKETILLVKIPTTKNYKPRTFIITDEFYTISKKYINLRPKNAQTSRFFLNYQNGKCTNQPVGINKFGKIPTIIASYLQLANPQSYTGHTFRRTGRLSATLLADWKSNTVAEGYIADEDLINNENFFFVECGADARAEEAAEAQFNVSCQSVVSQDTSFTASQMSYGAINPGIRDYAKENNAIIVDLRSDTLTKPIAAMRKAMFEAEVGDDVFEEDPTVKELQKMAATLLGKEDALFVSSGTMGNLIAVMNHCDVRGSEIYCGNESHVFLHEQGGAAQIAGVSICPLFNNDDGTFDLKCLESAIRVDRIHEPISKLVMVENTINGKVVPQSWVEELAMVAKKHNLRMHLDGARLWNASAASKISAKDLAAPFDSVTFCLSKGLGAPVGSVLCGSKSFIANARRRRKVLGGAMRQVGVIAAAGLVALEQTVPRLVEDHRKAFVIAEAINQLDTKIFSVDLKTTHTNMIFINVNTDSGISAETLMKRLHQVNDFNDDDDKIIIRCLALTERLVRMVLYYDIDDTMVAAAIRKLRYVIKELDPQVKTEIL
ncbi:uncharacterized protein LOC112457459 [Temnothorax curvispinosus]|uniref:Uncharacterized protein LOC112457459 n=1 Tax=Temnothorax curvispinosus TaxID=300111 RepID=A0A6J1Q4B8_9HYME|nr:uncharacterized protein LOC112457459 [Temnothorax curvispinosus]XP_024876296.1 uncharacterized protein LOC112457459 [Temnothorax curvispinosus]